MRAVAICAGLMLACTAAFADDTSMAIPAITILPSQDGVVVTASAIGLTEIEVDGAVSIDRIGSAGTITTRQSRALKLSPGRSEDIATTGLSLAAGDRISVRVTLQRDGKVVGEAEVKAGYP